MELRSEMHHMQVLHASTTITVVRMVKTHTHWAVFALWITLLHSRSSTNKTPILPSNFLPDYTFPTSMDVSPDDVISLTEHLIAAFETAPKNIGTALQYHDAKAKK